MLRFLSAVCDCIGVKHQDVFIKTLRGPSKAFTMLLNRIIYNAVFQTWRQKHCIYKRSPHQFCNSNWLDVRRIVLWLIDFSFEVKHIIVYKLLFPVRALINLEIGGTRSQGEASLKKPDKGCTELAKMYSKT